MNDYDDANGAIADAQAATESEWTKNTLNEADELKAKATKELYSSYRWLKTSAKVLHRLLTRVQRQVIQRDKVEDQLEKYFDGVDELNDMRDDLAIMQTPEQQEAQEAEIEAREAELDALYEQVWDTEEEA